MEKVKKPKETAEPEATTALLKKKGFLPATKKRKNRNNKQPITEGVAAPTPVVTPTDVSTGEKGQGKKKNKRKPKRKAAGDEEPSPAKKAKPQPGSKPGKKKGKKQRGEPK